MGERVGQREGMVSSTVMKVYFYERRGLVMTTDHTHKIVHLKSEGNFIKCCHFSFTHHKSVLEVTGCG